MVKLIILTPTCRFKMLLAAFGNRIVCIDLSIGLYNLCKYYFGTTGNDSFAIHDFITKMLINQQMKFSLTE